MARNRQIDERLTARQREVLRLIERGLSNQEIADRLGISLAGAKWHVSELISRLGVTSRDEVIEAWEARRRTGRWAWLGGLTGLSPLKLAAGGTAVAAIGGAATGAVLIPMALVGGTAPIHDNAVTAVAAATPVPLPNPPDAVFTGDEALQRAEAAITLGQSTHRLAKPLEPSDVTLVDAGWHPAITRFVASDPDLYWEAAPGESRNAWHFLWRASGIRTTGHAPFAIGVVEVEVLLEDGTGKFLARRAVAFDPVTPEARLGEHSFRSISQEEMRRLMSEPIADAVVAARANNEPGGEPLEIYPVAAGGWCAKFGSGATCAFPSVADQCLRLMPVTVTAAPGTGQSGRTLVAMVLDPDIAEVEVSAPDGQKVRVPADAPPPETGAQARFAYVVLGATSGVTAVAYDASGNEIVRETRQWGIAPPPPVGGFAQC